MLKKTLLTAVVLGLATTAVQASEVSGYLTGSIGQAKADKLNSAKDMHNTWNEIGGFPGVSSSTSTDRTDTAYKIAVGLKVNPYVALEAQYIDLGEASYKGGAYADLGGVDVSASQKMKSETNGFGANLVGTYPIEDFTLFAKVGYHYLKTKTSSKTSLTAVAGSVPVDSGYRSSSATIRQWTPSFGVGASYNITPELALVAEYERYKGAADKKANIDGERFSMKHDIDLASIGLRYNF